jgi:hypothetical protein
LHDLPLSPSPLQILAARVEAVRRQLLLYLALISSMCACSVGPTTTATTGGTSSGMAPQHVALTLDQMQGALSTDGTTTNGYPIFQVYPSGVAMRLADGTLVPVDSCPYGTNFNFESGCCVGPVSAFSGQDDAGCSGNAQAALYREAPLVAEPGTCEVTGAESVFSDPLSVSGITSNGTAWTANPAIASTGGFPDNLCPYLSFSDGAVWSWTPKMNSQIHALILDADVDGGGLVRISCSPSAASGQLVMPPSLLSSFAGAAAATVTISDWTDSIFDAGSALIEIRTQLTLTGSSLGAKCPIFP